MTLHSICLDLDYFPPSTPYRRSNFLGLFPSTYGSESPVGGEGKAKRSKRKKPTPFYLGP